MAVAEEWRERFEAKLEKFVQDKHGRVNERIDDCEERHEAFQREVNEHYVSKAMLALHLTNITDRYEPLRTALTRMMWLVVTGFIAGVARLVYVWQK